MIVAEKEINMSRLSKFLSVSVVVVFALACNMVTQPINDAQNLAQTAQALGTALPLETLQALASSIPAETLQALPSAVPTLEALATEFGDILNPQGTPVAEWNGIPVMPEAVAAEEVQALYSYKANVTSEAAAEFYTTRLPALGWDEQFNQPGDTTVIFYLKDSQSLTITITPLEDGSRLIWLALQ